MEFVFINVKEPRDALKLAKARGVRSHVTRYQWKRFGLRKPKKTLLVSQDVNGDKGDVGSEAHSSSNLDRISISPQIGGLRVDPFQSYPISSQPWTPLLVDHCESFSQLSQRNCQAN